jgi:polysaccharide biosynthesis/export protein
MMIWLLLFGAAAFGQTPVHPPSYILGPDDQVVIHVLDSDEIGVSPFRIDMRGYINVPLAGRLQAAGLTVDQLEVALVARLKEYLQTPVVTISVFEFRSQPVSVLGAVNTPGVHQIRGRKTLFEVISEAGGLKNEAGNSIKITRRKEFGSIPLPSAAPDPSGEFSVAEVSVKSVMEARIPQENIQIQPNDVISVPKAELVYVIGAVKRAGGFTLSEREQISVLQALSMAEGLDRVASPANARILRAADGVTVRSEIPVDLNRILTGKISDVQMRANDILFIPDSAAKSAAMRALEAAIQVGTGVAIYRR